MNFMGCVRGLRMLHIREVSTDLVKLLLHFKEHKIDWNILHKRLHHTK